MKNILVIGGSGFIGKYTVDELLSKGFSVTVYDLKDPQRNDVTFIKGSILDKKSVEKAVSANEYVYHLAGWADLETSSDNPSKVIELNILGTTNILEACTKFKIKKFIFASSMYVFSKTGSFYKVSKQCCELIIEEYHKNSGLNYCILRYGSLYGVGSTHGNAVYQILHQALKHGEINYWGTGNEVRQYISVKDVARGALIVLDEDFKDSYVSLTGLEDIKTSTLLEMINEILGGKIKINYSESPNNSCHYSITPFNFMPKTGRKLIFNSYKDLGQGVLECIHQIYNDLNNNKSYKNEEQTLTPSH